MAALCSSALLALGACSSELVNRPSGADLGRAATDGVGSLDRPALPDLSSPTPDRQPTILDQNLAKPDQKAVKPDQYVAKPDQKAVKPDQYVAKPDQKLVKPDQYVAKPDQKVVKPDQYVAKPDQYVVKPDQKLVKPDQYVVKPDQKLVKPDQYVVKPDSSIPQYQPCSGNNDCPAESDCLGIDMRCHPRCTITQSCGNVAPACGATEACMLEYPGAPDAWCIKALAPGQSCTSGFCPQGHVCSSVNGGAFICRPTCATVGSSCGTGGTCLTGQGGCHICSVAY